MTTIDKETPCIPFLFMGCWSVSRLIEKENHRNVLKIKKIYAKITYAKIT